MAGKLKGAGGIKGFFLLHGEKLAIGIVGLLALFLIYKTTSLPHLEDKYQANKLRDEISQTSSAVQQAAWPEPTSEQASEVRVFKPLTQTADAPVPPDQYKTGDTFDRTVVAPTILRPDPVILNAEEVRATGGSGLLAFLDEATRKRRELERAKEAEAMAKKMADEAAKQAKESAANAGGNARRRPGEELGANQPYDPDHPKRRAIQGSAQAVGIPLQGGERIERAAWAIVTAKVPIREQLKLYQDAFEKAKFGFDPTRDFPAYRGYMIQRSEVVPGKDLDWKPVATYDGQRASITGNKPIAYSRGGGVSQQVMEGLYAAATLSWAGMSPDVIDPRFFDYNLTFPLPPLVGRNWSKDGTHPDIPLIENTPPLEQEQAAMPETVLQQPAVGDENAFVNRTTNPGGFPGAPMGPGGGMRSEFGRGPMGPGGMGPGGMGPGGMGMMGRPMGGMGMEGGPGGGRGAMGSAPMSAGTARTSLPKGVDYILLRFVDFTVEPGKRYKYRVMLVLTDPNANPALPEAVFASEVLDRQAKEKAANNGKRAPDIRKVEKWSDPSPTVGIPLSGDVRLVDVKPFTPERINDEPVAKMLVQSFDIDEKGNAIQAANEKELRRGAVANMVEDAEYLGDGPWIDTRDKFKFVTGMAVLDMDGGNKLARDYTSPGRVLVMGPAGEFYIRNEMDDKQDVVYHKLLFAKEPRGVNGEFGPGGPPPRGGRPGGPGGPGR
jgi:hypothetical protein